MIWYWRHYLDFDDWSFWWVRWRRHFSAGGVLLRHICWTSHAAYNRRTLKTLGAEEWTMSPKRHQTSVSLACCSIVSWLSRSFTRESVAWRDIRYLYVNSFCVFAFVMTSLLLAVKADLEDNGPLISTAISVNHGLGHPYTLSFFFQDSYMVNELPMLGVWMHRESYPVLHFSSSVRVYRRLSVWLVFLSVVGDAVSWRGRSDP